MNKNGFTLIEMLFVLGILSVLLLVTVPLNIQTLDKQRTKQFLDTFEFDVLYIQSLTSTSDESEPIRIRFHDDHYKIRQGRKTLTIRSYPSGLTLDKRTGDTITFSNSGTILDPRTLKVKANDGDYHIVFPLGKGRCYIVKL